MKSTQVQIHAVDTLTKTRLALQAFLPKSLDERMGKLQERLTQKWPTFGQCGLSDLHRVLHIQDHEVGTVVFFFEDPKTFVGIGAVKHGAYWHLSKTVGAATRMNNRQMQFWLKDQNLNWVVVL